ncbi:MAG: nucleotidyltransferase family protein [Oscillospiraceae bacterium]|jgi:predicted nucleotidyltransferase|nr:nucleotidyltransferase family protein [Oscillospiraceae bacterium]
MRVAGIVAEYNLFHQGHAFLLAQTRAAGATHIVCVLSGNFVQRGAAAIVRKEARAAAAIAAGADLVLELPVTFALSPARRFAYGSVFLLDALGCVDTLSFGSECGNVSAIQNTARALSLPETQALLHAQLRQGLSFAAAAELALHTEYADLGDILRTPNDTLGVEYCAALAELHSTMRPMAVQRITGSGTRAADLRRAWHDGADVLPLLPEATQVVVRAEIAAGRAPVRGERLETAILARLKSMRTEQFADLPEVREGLENRLYKAARTAGSLDELIALVKTRRYTHASLRRTALHALLGIGKSDCAPVPPYIRVLAMGAGAAEILRAAKHSARLPIVQRGAQLRRLDTTAQTTAALERRVDDIYNLDP